MRVVTGLLTLLLAGSAGGMQPHDLLGLQLTVEPVAQIVRVDGVDMRIRRAQGDAVPELVRRIATRWRAEGHAVQSLQQRGWQMLTRLGEGRSELIQWRGEGSTAELLHSSLDAVRLPLRATSAPFRLPSRCAWGRAVESLDHGAWHLQRTAACAAPAGEVWPVLRSLLSAQDWQVHDLGGASFELQRKGVMGRLLFTDGGSEGGSVLLWVGMHAGPQRRP